MFRKIKRFLLEPYHAEQTLQEVEIAAQAAGDNPEFVELIAAIENIEIDNANRLHELSQKKSNISEEEEIELENLRWDSYISDNIRKFEDWERFTLRLKHTEVMQSNCYAQFFPDYIMLNYPQLKDSLFCPILRNITSTPVLLPNCPQIFDRAMLKNWLESNKTNPWNNKPASVKEIQTPKLATFVDRILQSSAFKRFAEGGLMKQQENSRIEHEEKGEQYETIPSPTPEHFLSHSQSALLRRRTLNKDQIHRTHLGMEGKTL